MKLVEMDKNCPQTWCVVGNCFSLQREPEVALKFFLRALQVIKERTLISRRNFLYLRVNFYVLLVVLIVDQITFIVKRLLLYFYYSLSIIFYQIDPCFTYAHTLYGHELANNEDLDKAVQSFRHSLLHDDRHYNAWCVSTNSQVLNLFLFVFFIFSIIFLCYGRCVLLNKFSVLFFMIFM